MTSVDVIYVPRILEWKEKYDNAKTYQEYDLLLREIEAIEPKTETGPFYKEGWIHIEVPTLEDDLELLDIMSRTIKLIWKSKQIGTAYAVNKYTDFRLDYYFLFSPMDGGNLFIRLYNVLPSGRLPDNYIIALNYIVKKTEAYRYTGVGLDYLSLYLKDDHEMGTKEHLAYSYAYTIQYTPPFDTFKRLIGYDESTGRTLQNYILSYLDAHRREADIVSVVKYLVEGGHITLPAIEEMNQRRLVQVLISAREVPRLAPNQSSSQRIVFGELKGKLSKFLG